MGRLHFHYIDGLRAKANSGMLSVLVAYGKSNAERLKSCGIMGKYIQLKRGKKNEEHTKDIRF